MVSGCSELDQHTGSDEMITIDGEPVSLAELYGDDAVPIAIRPIGHVVRKSTHIPRDSGTADGDISEIHLYPGMARFMTGLEDETSLLILWHFHKAGPVKSIFARGFDRKRVGPFASRTPNRLTPIAATEVELVEVKGTTLVVRNLDAFDGTPVLDIKVSMASLERSREEREKRASSG
jgi:tRNA (Thr-GGU) A37 N-methylase